MGTPLPRPLARRLREVYRSAGWPAHDAFEIELLAAGLLERVGEPGGRECLRVTAAGVQALAETLQRNRGAFDAHEALVGRVAQEMAREGRICWRTLSLRSRVDDAWVLAQPDVYSVRHTTLEDALAPWVHEVKVRRADLLAELRQPRKGAAYLAMASACSLVIADGIAEPEEIPLAFGVIVARRTELPGGVPGFGRLEMLRAAPRRAMRLPFAVWMALARATPCEAPLDDPQAALGDPGEPAPGAST